MKLAQLLLSLSFFVCSAKGTMNYELVALSRTDLTEKIATQLQQPLRYAELRQFADGEIDVKLANPGQFAGKVAVILQSTGDPVNEHTLGVAFLAHELKNAGARKVIAVIPYLGYARHDESSIAGKSGNVAVIAKLFETAGIDEFISVDLHDEKIIDFFSIPVHNLQVQSIIADHIKSQEKSLHNVCLVAPDKGAGEYVEDVAHKIGVGTLIFSKERFSTDQTRITGLTGECEGTTGIIIDDIIATGGTALNVCNSLPEMGYENIYGYFVHPVLAGNAVERIEKSCFSKIFVSNTLPLRKEALESSDIEVFDVSSVIVKELQKLL